MLTECWKRQKYSSVQIVLQLRGSQIEMGTEGKRQVKGIVSVREVHEPKVRVASAKSPNICSSTVIFCSCVCIKNRRSLSSYLIELFFMIEKLALRTNKIKRQRAINQSYRIIHTFDLRQNLPKYIRTFLHENVVLMIGLEYQSDYSICHFMVTIFIHTVRQKQVNSSFI